MATLPGNTAKRFQRVENHLESQLPIIPSGKVGQTSCSDQLQSADGLGLCLPLHEIRPKPKHKIFLSHSRVQKSFVKQLCKDIERYDRYPFLDTLRTSLSIGCHFPNAIFEAIGQCQVAVVVLSEDFFSRTKWPMLELSTLVKRKGRDPDLIIMPMFLGLTREQCRSRENHDRWFSLWEKWAKEDSRIILDDWMAVFKVFGYMNSVFLCGGDEVKCREDIVDAVCKEVPSETRRDDSHVQGRLRMCKIIDEKIGGLELSKCFKVRVLGLYGVGGIGKSTACMTLCNQFFEEFRGRVCHVEFGVGDQLHMLREILKRLTDTRHEQIDGLNIDECKHKMKDIKHHKVLLAIDNVFESYEIVEQAKLILRVGFEKSSIVIVTTRSLGELQNLNLEKRECMEMPELTVDDAISLFVQQVACDKSSHMQLILQCVKRCYFRKGDGSTFHYHPLALQVLGGQLGSDPSQWLEKLKAIDVFNQYQEKPDKHPIFSILRRSFDVLTDEDQLLFIDCALFAICCSYRLTIEDGLYRWLSMIHGKQIKSRLNGLKQKSLIQSLEEGTTGIGIHDLWREFCVMETKVGELKSRRWIYERWSDANDQIFEESNIYSGVWKRVQRVSMMGPYIGPFRWTCNVHLNLSRCSCLVTLHLENVKLEGNVLDLNGVYNLKSLKIKIYSECKVLGLGCLQQLCLLEWWGRLPSNMAFIVEIGGLTSLQSLNLGTLLAANIEFPNLRSLSLLQCVAFRGLDEGVFVSFNSTMSNLQKLHLECCNSLQRCHGIGDLVELEELEIHSCSKLEELPNLQGLQNLKKLDIRGCSSIQTLLGVGDLVTLLKLRVQDLVELPDLSKLTNLQVLELSECSLNRALMELSELINLQECTISIDGIGEFNDLHKLTKLLSLTVEGWSPQGSSSVDSLVNLEKLCIKGCRGVDSLGGLSKIFGLCTIELNTCEFKDVSCLKDMIGLREVCILHCDHLDVSAIIFDMLKATRLETLYIFRIGYAISSKAIGADLSSGGTFSNLRYLHLFDSPITKLLDLSNFPQLEELHIGYCPSLVTLTSSVPLTSLKVFAVTKCKNLTTIPNVSGCKHLERVIVRGCGVTLSENDMRNLSVLCPKIDFGS